LTSDYVTYARGAELPRIPLKASIDLTYRCNHRCRHCWLWTPDTPDERAAELTTEEWRTLVDQARALGTREWAISGGEPMLREDFTEIFEYLTSKATTYSLNTNGTLITPQIAQLLKRKGNKMVAVYGASAEVYDHVTRNPGGFDALLQGLAYLKKAGAGFTMQLIPMRDNWHQWDEMVAFAQSWSRHWRIGAPWLFKTACGDPVRNAEIERQRLDPADVVALDPPEVTFEERRAGQARDREAVHSGTGDRLCASCIERSRDFHVDPNGRMSFCCFAKDPTLRYDLRSGSASAGWEEFIPSLTDVARGGAEYREGCAACELRSDCRWCDVYGFLEHRRHGARVEYLCAVARENRVSKAHWVRHHRRYYKIAEITIQVESDLPITESTFARKFDHFRVDRPGEDTVVVRHHFGLPETRGDEKGVEVFRKVPWAIYRKGKSWIYEGFYEELPPRANDPQLLCVALFTDDHSRAEIYNEEDKRRIWSQGSLESLTMFPTDQILLARLLADRAGCLVHSGCLTIDGQGLLFVGQSGMGKSTTMELVRSHLGDRVEILCDDRNIVRRWPEGFRVHGTWSHGDIPEVSSASAPLRAILFLEQDVGNVIEPLEDRIEVWERLLPRLIKPMVTAEWWHKELDVLAGIVDEIPCYIMRFDKSGAIVPELERLTR
jgi:molybdenum cofactor biosynthesis enzyme MoaA